MIHGLIVRYTVPPLDCDGYSTARRTDGWVWKRPAVGKTNDAYTTLEMTIDGTPVTLVL
jgi:hypothetical protein